MYHLTKARTRNFIMPIKYNVYNKYPGCQETIKTQDRQGSRQNQDIKQTQESDNLELLRKAIEAKRYYEILKIIKSIPPNSLSNDFITLAFNSKDLRVVRLIVEKTACEGFDGNILLQALNSNQSSIVKLIAENTASIYFDKNILNLVMNTKNEQISKIIVDQTDESYFDKKILIKAIEKGNAPLFEAVAEKTDRKCFNKEILKRAVYSGNYGIVGKVCQISLPENFDKELLKIAIECRKDSILIAIAEKTDKKMFDKEILQIALKSKSSSAVYRIGSYTDRNLFDKEILEKALETKEPSLVKPVIDYIVDKNLLTEYKDKIQTAVLAKDDIASLAAQMLSRVSNESVDREMQEVIIDIYMDVIHKHYLKGDISANFPMQKFDDSIEESRNFFKNPESINFSSLNDKSKFLILPVYTFGHAFSAVVRKQDDNKISITYVNLAPGVFEKPEKDTAYREYIFSKENALDILKKYCYNLRLYYPGRVETPDIAYRDFSEKSLEEYPLRVTSRCQKTGNCFVKNIEKGLRFAMALSLSSTLDKNFDTSNLRGFSEKEKKYKVKFLEPFFKSNDKSTRFTTLQLKKELFHSLKNKFPQFEKDITKEWGIYKDKKEVKVGKKSERDDRKK